jgi:hypothetical protein
MWRELVQSLSSRVRLSAPAQASVIARVERELGLRLPAELQQLLLESNGIEGDYGASLVWPIEAIRAQNLTFRARPDFRSLYMPFDCLLFFANAGSGSQYAYAVLDGAVRRTDVYLWNHENDSRLWVAPSLQQYLGRCLGPGAAG